MSIGAGVVAHIKPPVALNLIPVQTPHHSSTHSSRRPQGTSRPTLQVLNLDDDNEVHPCPQQPCRSKYDDQTPYYFYNETPGPSYHSSGANLLQYYPTNQAQSLVFSD